MDTDKKFIIATVVITLVILVGAVVWASSQSPRITPETSIAPEILISDRGYNIMGNPQAPITLVEFSDPQCPSCKTASTDVKNIMEEFKGQIRLIYRHFPLPMHPQSIPATHAVEAAGKQDKFFQMLDSIFANQDRLPEGDKLLEEIAISLDLNIEQFNQDRNSSEIADIINQDRDTATKIRVDATPTFFVNGKIVPTVAGKSRIQSLRDSITSAYIDVIPTGTTPIATDSATESTPSAK